MNIEELREIVRDTNARYPSVIASVPQVGVNLTYTMNRVIGESTRRKFIEIAPTMDGDAARAWIEKSFKEFAR